MSIARFNLKQGDTKSMLPNIMDELLQNTTVRWNNREMLAWFYLLHVIGLFLYPEIVS